jgi:Mrp family chromosome partitioning ATPase
MDRYAKGAAARPLAPQHAGTTIVRFAPSWEVDQFNWPPVCSELQDCWVSPLNSVVRSVVRQAWQGGNIVAVTQAVRGEGSTTLALCLGRIASAFQIPVALIDGHRHNSGVAAALRLHFELGWDETSPNCPLEEAAIRSLQDGLVVLPIRPGDLRQDWEVPDDLRARMLDQLAASFELVIVDVGPMFVAAHEWFAGPLAGRISCALVVRDVRTTESAQTDDVCHRLRTAGVRNVSIIENFQLA